MVVLKGFKNGYEKAIEDMRNSLNGCSSQNSGGAGALADPLPQLPMEDYESGSQQSGGNSGQGSGQGNSGGSSGQGEQGQDEMTDISGNKIDGNTKQEANDTAVCEGGGGWLSQEAGAKLAKQAGYDQEDCKVESATNVTKQWKEAAVKACAHQMGKGMGNIIATFDKLYKTSTDWKKMLRLYVGKALSKIENAEKIGRKKPLATRGELRKFTKPGERDLDKVIFCIDTSGSVSDDLLKILVSECWAIAKKKHIQTAEYVMFDDGVTDAITVKGDKMPKFGLKGRGGTDFVKLFKYLDEHYSKSKIPLTIVFTDGYCHPIPDRLRWMDNLIWVAYDNNSFGDKLGKETGDAKTKVIYLNSKDVK